MLLESLEILCEKSQYTTGLQWNNTRDFYRWCKSKGMYVFLGEKGLISAVGWVCVCVLCVQMKGQLPWQYAAAVNHGWLPNRGSKDPCAMLGDDLQTVNDTLQKLELQTTWGWSSGLIQSPRDHISHTPLEWEKSLSLAIVPIDFWLPT